MRVQWSFAQIKTFYLVPEKKTSSLSIQISYFYFFYRRQFNVVNWFWANNW